MWVGISAVRVSGICVLGPWPPSHQGLAGHQDSSDTRHSPLLLHTKLRVSLSIPGTDISDAQPSPSLHNTTVITLQSSRDRRGYPITAAGSLESTNISRSYCRGRVSLQQNMKDKQSKSFKSPLGALCVVPDYGSRWLHTYRTCVCLDAHHSQPVWSDTGNAF